MKIPGVILPGLLLLLTSAELNAIEINLVTVDYPPYYGSTLKNERPLTEIVTLAFEKVGYQVDVTYVPWARAVKEAKAGRADGLHGAWYSDERTEWFVYSDKLPGNELVFFKRKGTGPDGFTTYDDLKPYKVGIVRGYRNPPEFDTAKLKTSEAASDKLNILKLGKGRVDLALIDRANAKYILANELTEYQDSLEAIEPPVEVLPMYLLISKKIDDHQKKVDDFNRGLKILIDEGGVDEILKRHNM